MGRYLPLAFFLLVSCASTPSSVETEDSVVVHAFLVEGEPVREVYVERVAPLEGFYRPEDHGVRGAVVRVWPVAGGDTLRFFDDPAQPGHYLPHDTTWVPRAKTRYRFEAQVGDLLLWAETVVPDTFDLWVLPRPIQGDTLTRLDPPMVLQWTPAEGAGGYTLSVVCLAPEDSLVPLDPESDPSDAEDDSLGQYAAWIMRDDQHSLTVPWILFRWAGPYQLWVNAVCAEYYQYVFAWMRIAGGVQMRPPTNVHGGMGIVAGLSRRGFQFWMRPVTQGFSPGRPSGGCGPRLTSRAGPRLP